MTKPRVKANKPAPAPKAAPTLSDRGNGGELHQIASTDADTLIACGKSGVAAVTLGAPPENAPASGRRPREGLAAGGLAGPLQRRIACFVTRDRE